MKRLYRFLISELGRIIIGAILFVAALVIEKKVNTTVALVLYIVDIFVVGCGVFFSAIKGIIRRDLLDEQFLMSIASIGAMILGEYSEGVAVLLFFMIGEYFQHKAVGKSRAAIRGLMDICADEAHVMTDSGEETVDAEDVEVGTIIVVRPGERVPIDAVVVSGTADVDTSAITGESVPVPVTVGGEIRSGSIVLDGVITARTVCEFSESTASKILELVENANERKSKTENFITSFSHFYTPTIVVLALCMAVIPSLFGWTTWGESISRALTFLVISCPCALVISVPMAFFGGIGSAASQGILFKGGNVFSSLVKAHTVAFDKTGTLTSGEFTISDVYTVDCDAAHLMSIAATLEKNSNHPIARAIAAGGEIISDVTNISEIAGRGVKATVGDVECLVGNALLLEGHGIAIPDDLPEANVYVAEDCRCIGAIKVEDNVREEAHDAISSLKKLGVSQTVILSGDKAENVTRVATKLGIDNSFAALLPDEKFEKLEELCKDGKVVYVGDGINDAPSLARADVGVAMGAIGTDAAIEAADVVIMTDNLDKLPRAVKTARKTLAISKENIVFALGVKFAILLLAAFGYAGMWLAVFADVGVAVLAILNSMRTLSKGR